MGVETLVALHQPGMASSFRSGQVVHGRTFNWREPQHNIACFTPSALFSIIHQRNSRRDCDALGCGYNRPSQHDAKAMED